MVEAVFGMQVHEQLVCSACGILSHKVTSHVEYFQIIQATSLRALHVAGGGTMGAMILEADSQHHKKCDKV